MKKMFLLLLCFCLLVSCTNSDIVATVGSTKITKGEFEFYLSSIKSQLSGTELQTDEDWQTQEIEGEKAIDVAKQRALEIAVANAEYGEAAKAQGITLTEQEKQNVKSMKQQVVSSYGGETAYKQFLKDNNITDGFIQLMCEATVYYEKLADKLAEEEPLTEEALEEYYNSNKNALNSEYRKAKHILILTQDTKTGMPLSEEEQQAAKNFADELYAKVQGGEDFDGLMQKYSQDPGLSTSPDGYVFTSGEMVPEFEQAVDSVSIGGITLCKSDYGYHIIKRLPVEYSDIEDKIFEAAMKDKIAAKLKDWERSYNIQVIVNEDIIKSVK